MRNPFTNATHIISLMSPPPKPRKGVNAKNRNAPPNKNDAKIRSCMEMVEKRIELTLPIPR
jgi:hypothetical protein